MKKNILSFLTITALIVINLGPLGVAFADSTINTGLTRSTGGGEAPIIKTKWEMNGPAWDQSGYFTGVTGTDDSTNPGAQFMPTGQWDTTKKFSICAVVTDPDGLSDINGVYTDWFYPKDIALGENHVNSEELGCGLQYGDENALRKLDKADGLKLFCDDIKNHNNNLPTFYGIYDYNEICGATGELEKEEAAVYCADKKLKWEDPAGNYRVDVLALDEAGVHSYENAYDGNETWDAGEINWNFFEYLPLTAFEVDFASVDYGSVKLNTHKIISGDLTWDPATSTKPTVRNTGNTRLQMGVEQDDMGLGTTDGGWNVRYDGRVGNGGGDWKNYFPDDPVTWLLDTINLSETEEMDFSIEIFKFPTTATSFTGDMWLSAQSAPALECSG